MSRMPQHSMQRRSLVAEETGGIWLSSCCGSAGRLRGRHGGPLSIPAAEQASVLAPVRDTGTWHWPCSRRPESGQGHSEGLEPEVHLALSSLVQVLSGGDSPSPTGAAVPLLAPA